jgi:hypothetical protein
MRKIIDWCNSHTALLFIVNMVLLFVLVMVRTWK